MRKKSDEAHTPPLGGKGRGGRPAVADDMRRVHRVEVYLSVQEIEAIKNSAEAARLKTPAFMRSAALGLKIAPTPSLFDVEKSRELTLVANNLARIIRAVAQGRVVVADVAEIVQLRILVDAIAGRLLGVRNDCAQATW